MTTKTPEQVLLKAFGSASEVARQAGVSRQAVHLWFLRGRVSNTAAHRLAEILGIPARRLLAEWVPTPRLKRAKPKGRARR